MSEGSYHWTNHEHNEEYETLFRPDGTEVTTITEPEDRNFYRDLAPVCVELNALQTENARLREQVEALADALRQERHDLRWTLIALPGNHWPQYRIDDVYPAMPHIVRAIKEGVANE